MHIADTIKEALGEETWATLSEEQIQEVLKFEWYADLGSKGLGREQTKTYWLERENKRMIKVIVSHEENCTDVCPDCINAIKTNKKWANRDHMQDCNGCDTCKMITQLQVKNNKFAPPAMDFSHFR